MKKILTISLLALLSVSFADETTTKNSKDDKSNKTIKIPNPLQPYKDYKVRAKVIECLRLSNGAKSSVGVTVSAGGKGVASYTSNNISNTFDEVKAIIDTSTGPDSGWRFDQTNYCLTVDIIGAKQENIEKSEISKKSNGMYSKIINPSVYIIAKSQNTGAEGGDPEVRMNLGYKSGYMEWDCEITGNPKKEYYPSECR